MLRLNTKVKIRYNLPEKSHFLIFTAPLQIELSSLGTWWLKKAITYLSYEVETH